LFNQREEISHPSEY